MWKRGIYLFDIFDSVYISPFPGRVQYIKAVLNHPFLPSEAIAASQLAMEQPSIWAGNDAKHKNKHSKRGMFWLFDHFEILPSYYVHSSL